MHIIDKDNPFLAKITERYSMNKAGSKKCTMYLKLDISGSGIDYKVGDSIAVLPENDIHIVQETLNAIKASGDETIKDSKSDKTYKLKDFLIKKANISRVTKKQVAFIYEHLSSDTEKKQLEELLLRENKDKLKTYCQERQLWDFLKEFKSLKVEPQRFCDILPALLPRFYSIASSQRKNKNEIDLLIAYFNYKTNQHLRFGVASHYLCQSAPLKESSIPIYVHPSRGFTVPEDDTKPLIMVGPGTGLAPFIGFLQERIARGATGENWLFFGEWNSKYDFFYQDYLEECINGNQLKLFTAFSRDQEQKVYVQNKMLENSRELFALLQKGATFCVCGDATHMAKDVDNALFNIIKEEGKLTEEEAKEYLKEMKTQNRYIRDVY